jgi:hypothetical protein
VLKYKDEDDDLCTLTESTIPDFLCLSESKPGAPVKLYGETAAGFVVVEEKPKQLEEVAQEEEAQVTMAETPAPVAETPAQAAETPEPAEAVPPEVSELMAIGFTREAVVIALAAADGRPDMALEYLLACPQETSEEAKQEEEEVSQQRNLQVCTASRIDVEPAEAAAAPANEEEKEESSPASDSRCDRALEAFPADVEEEVPNEEQAPEQVEPDVEYLVFELGFEMQAAREALAIARGQKEWAIDYLLTGRHPTRMDMVAQDIRQAGAGLKRQVSQHLSHIREHGIGGLQTCPIVTKAKESQLGQDVCGKASSAKQHLSRAKGEAQEQLHKLDAQLREAAQKASELLKARGQGCSSGENSNAPSAESENSAPGHSEEVVEGSGAEEGAAASSPSRDDEAQEPLFRGASSE